MNLVSRHNAEVTALCRRFGVRRLELFYGLCRCHGSHARSVAATRAGQTSEPPADRAYLRPCRVKGGL